MGSQALGPNGRQQPPGGSRPPLWGDRPPRCVFSGSSTAPDEAWEAPGDACDPKSGTSSSIAYTQCFGHLGHLRLGLGEFNKGAMESTTGP